MHLYHVTIVITEKLLQCCRPYSLTNNCILTTETAISRGKSFYAIGSFITCLTNGSKKANGVRYIIKTHII